MPPPPSLPAVCTTPNRYGLGLLLHPGTPHFPLILIIEKRYIFSFLLINRKRGSQIYFALEIQQIIDLLRHLAHLLLLPLAGF